MRLGEDDVVMRAFAHGQVVPDGADGFLVVGSDSFRQGVFAARVGPAGALVSPLSVIHDAWQLSELDLAPLPGGGAVLVGNTFPIGGASSALVARLDANGAIEAVWEGRDALPYFLVPAVNASTGRIFVQSTAIDGYNLEIREFGCAR